MIGSLLHNARRMPFILFPFVSLASPAWADAPAPTTLPEVIVQAPSPDRGISPPPDYPPATLYDDTYLALGHERTVDEVLLGEPGVSVNKGAFGVGLLALRGAAGQGLMTLDGLPVPDSLPGITNLNAVLPDGLERVEVERGFSTASRAFAALGGGIRMRSRQAVDNSGDLRVEGGSFGFLKETLRGNLSGERGHIAITANRSDAFDGAWHAQKSNGNPERDPFHGTQVLTRADTSISDAVNWEGSLLYRSSWNAWDRYGIRNGKLGLTDDPDAFFAEEVWMVQNSVKARFADGWNSRVQLGYTQTRNLGHTLGLKLGYDTDLYQARWENEQRLWQGGAKDSVHLIWGAEGRHERAVGPTYLPVGPFVFAPGNDFSQERTQSAGFVETRFRSGSLSGDVGVRHEAYSRFADQTLVHAGLALDVHPRLSLRANGGNGFRIPSYAERLFPLLGNLYIKPERGIGGDLGLEWRPRSDLKLALTGFHSRYDQLIIVTWNPALRPDFPCVGECLSNLPHSTVTGLELSGEYRFNPDWRGGLAYTYSRNRDIDHHRDVPFRPRNSLHVWGEWQMNAIPATLWMEGTYRGVSYNDVENSLIVHEALRINAQIDYKMMRMLELYVRGENLTGNRTSDVYSFYYPGAAVYAGLVLKW